MTINDCLFYAFDSLSLDVSLEDVAKFVVARLYTETSYHLKRSNIEFKVTFLGTFGLYVYVTVDRYSITATQKMTKQRS